MEARAPAVVAVVVTTGPAPGLEATLSTLVGQDYEELSVLVVANGTNEDVVARVAAVAPNVFVKVLEENRGFAAACNEAVLMVSGAAFLLFCHDDVLFFEGSVRQLVEAAFRTNAGIVTPKVVAYDDHFILMHVGQVADRFGTVRERVELGEIDHGQQDLERDVFVAPGGVTLVRTDLFETLHGFDPLIPALGEDLDLCWRAQVAGARIIVAPSAVIAHRQTLATGERPVTAVGTRRTSRMDLQRRHQLATVLTCWSPVTLLHVVPSLVVLDAAECVVALVGRDLDRFGAIVGSWRWVLRNRRHLRSRRRELAAVRTLKDAEIVRLQVGGASRVKTFFSTFFQDGLDRARGILPDEPVEENEDVEFDTVGFATAFVDDDTYEEIITAEHHDARRKFSQAFNGARSQAIVLSLLAVLWLYGSRNLIVTPLPVVGRLAPLDSWWSTWRHFFASWSPNGVGTGSPAMPGYGVLGFFGTFVLGRMGILARAVLLFSVPFGTWGVWRLLRGVVSNRARVAASFAYLAFPIGINLIQRGRIDTLVVVAVLPFATRRLLSLLNVADFAPSEWSEPVRFGRFGWGRTRAGQRAVLTLQVALMTAMAPAALVVVELLIVGVVIGQWLTPRASQRLERPLRLGVRVAVGTALLLAPMTFDTLVAGRRALNLFGLPLGAWSGLGISHVVRGIDGGFGFGWGGWLVPIVALVAVPLTRDVRREHAAKIAVTLSLVVLVAVLVGRGWLASFAPDVDALMVLVGLCLAVLVALTVAAIENDLVHSNFGWHQFAATVAVVALFAVSLPFVASVSSGRFGLPSIGTPESLGSLAPNSLGGYRILWLGDPRALPLSGWSVAPGLAAATTTNSLPDGSELFAPTNSGATDDLLRALTLALYGKTQRLGQLLAPSGIAAIVVMSAAAPTLTGFQNTTRIAPPAALIPALERQGDLALSAKTGGVLVFTNTHFHGIVAERAATLSPKESSSDLDSVTGWTPVLDFGYRAGPLRAGTVLAGVAPATAFVLRVNGKDVGRNGVLGWAASYSTPAGNGTLVLHQLPLNGLFAAATLALWVVVALGFGAFETLGALFRRRPRRASALTAPLAASTVVVDAPSTSEALDHEPEDVS